MKSKILKSVLAVGLAAVMLLAGSNVRAIAAPEEIITNTVTTSKSGSIGGIATSANLSTNNLKSTATTSFSGGGATATVSKELGGSDVVGGRSYHKIVWNSYTWSPTLTVGEIPSVYYYV